jgi:hypothetical protein
MTKGTRLLIMVFILIAVVVGMTQCMQKAMHKKKAHPQDGRAPIPRTYLAESMSVVRAGGGTGS